MFRGASFKAIPCSGADGLRSAADRTQWPTGPGDRCAAQTVCGTWRRAAESILQTALAFRIPDASAGLRAACAECRARPPRSSAAPSPAPAPDDRWPLPRHGPASTKGLGLRAARRKCQACCWSDLVAYHGACSAQVPRKSEEFGSARPCCTAGVQCALFSSGCEVRRNRTADQLGPRSEHPNNRFGCLLATLSAGDRHPTSCNWTAVLRALVKGSLRCITAARVSAANGQQGVGTCRPASKFHRRKAAFEAVLPGSSRSPLIAVDPLLTADSSVWSPQRSHRQGPGFHLCLTLTPVPFRYTLHT